MRGRVTWLGRALDATVGRRLLVRIWLHGIVLFAGVMITVFVARFVLPGHDAALNAHTHPVFSVGLAERALAMRTAPAALAGELRAIPDDTALALTVYHPG